MNNVASSKTHILNTFTYGDLLILVFLFVVIVLLLAIVSNTADIVNAIRGDDKNNTKNNEPTSTAAKKIK